MVTKRRSGEALGARGLKRRIDEEENRYDDMEIVVGC
jgi:hypothetical protein